MNQFSFKTRTIIIEEELNKLSPESQRRICRYFAADLIESIIYQRQINQFNGYFIKEVRETLVKTDNYEYQVSYWVELDPIKKKLVYKSHKDFI